MALTPPLFKDGICQVCFHMEGDHERFPGTQVWTCDEDGCDEDLRGYCTASRAILKTKDGG